MILQTETDIAAPVPKVWRALTEFGCYPNWHPHWEISGVPVLGARVHLGVGVNPDKRVRMRARIIALKDNEELAFSSGVFFARAREYFLLEAASSGTLLYHRTEITGLAALQFRNQAERDKLQAVYARRIDALRKYVTAGAALKLVSRGRPRTRI
ncbi:SRPBCC family protein [Caulobacter sp.]|jgi:uncharacterized protein YndB with AHSA1/START domain|uniref:SRPBCC family protein n=1 Tax=unclassified Caulobacter TaxID=2648921 RepID=UPI0016109735|nr:hypothetical protein [Caulobacter sp. RHG1]